MHPASNKDNQSKSLLPIANNDGSIKDGSLVAETSPTLWCVSRMA